MLLYKFRADKNEVHWMIEDRIRRATLAMHRFEFQTGLQQRLQNSAKGAIVNDIDLSHLLNKISQWRLDPQFDGLEALLGIKEARRSTASHSH